MTLLRRRSRESVCLLGAGTLGRGGVGGGVGGVNNRPGGVKSVAMARGAVGLVYDERMCKHRSKDPNHHERPERVTTIYQVFKDAGVPQRCVQVEARKATTEELQTVHSTEYVAQMQDTSRMGWRARKKLEQEYNEISNEIYLTSGSSESALLAAGSVIEVATQVAEGTLAAGACVVRPPGHHAEADTAMGFCIFNNVAVAAQILVHKKKELGVEKVLIVDWDVHHGNGTQNMFWDDPQVLYFSVHRYDDGNFYPFTNEGNFDKVGHDKGEGYNINVPWPHGGFGNADYMAVWEHVLMPVAREFNPDMVLISAGFDSASGDPLGQCEVTPKGFYSMTQQLMELAEGRVVLALEGGYNPVSISYSYLACMQALLNDPYPEISWLCDLLPETLPTIEKVRSELKKYWPILGTELKVPGPLAPTPAPSTSAEGLSSQFDIDEGLTVRAPMKESELKKKLPVQPPLEDEHGSCSKILNDPSRGQQDAIILASGAKTRLALKRRRTPSRTRPRTDCKPYGC